MNSGKTIFAQLMDFLPEYEFRKCVEKYQGHYKIKSFSCWDQFLCLAFAQLTYRESLRDIEACLRVAQPKLYHMGFRGQVSRNTLANANQVRDWRIYADFAQVLIHIAQSLYANEDFGLELDQTVYALDSTTIDLCLSLFPWAKFRKRKGAVKLHTLLDLRGSIPTVILITHGKVHDIQMLDHLWKEPGAIYLMDRGYVDFARLYKIHQDMAFFVTRTKSNFNFKRLYSHPIDKLSGLQCDQTIVPVNYYAKKDYPEKLRRIRFLDLEKNQRLIFLTNNFSLPALTITELYRCRWRSRVVFQMDQTTSTNQGILWHFRKCGQDPNMDCHLGLSARGHNQETVKLRFEPLHNFTDFERHAFRKNPYFTGSFVGSHPVSRGAYR